jgi:hypothetical protein
VVAPCTIQYPFTSPVARTSVAFNESTVLKAFRPTGNVSAEPGQTIQAFYSDEHALTLGIRQVTIKTSGGTTMPMSTVTASPTAPACVSPVQVGFTDLTGDTRGTDTADRPIWPALFITDITANSGACSPADYNTPTGKTCCDWQALNDPTLSASCSTNQLALPPDSLCGIWKAAVRTVDKTTSPEGVTVTPDRDPTSQNQFNLGAGSDPVPTLGGGVKSEGYGTEARWDIDTLKSAGVLQSGHTYRFQFMGHDGDQNKTGGDVGEACVNVAVP